MLWGGQRIGGGGGGGYVPGTGSSKAAAHATPVIPRLRDQITRATNWTFTAVIVATGVPQPLPGIFVPPGCGVRLRANNATTAGNAQVIRAGTYPAQLLQGGGNPLAPLDDIPFQVDNTGKIWIAGTAGDGVVVSINSAVQGA
jgi:FtsP/CotA-like multicopper oxidase with cupredoxin domain